MADIELTTIATVPTGATLTVTVYEDVGGDGSGPNTDPNGKAYDNSATQSVGGGTNTYTLTGFNASESGDDHWIEAELDGTDITASAALEPVTLSFSATTPQNLTATAISGDQIDLSWDDSVNEDGYAIERSQTSGSGFTQIDTVGANVTTYSDTGLEDGERYFYRVKATGAEGDSGYSNEAAATTDLPAPSIDSLGTSTENEVTVNWSLNDDSADGDVIAWYNTSSGAGPFDGGSNIFYDGPQGPTDENTNPPSTNSATATGLADGERYYFHVERRTGHADATSPEQSAITLLPTPSDVQEVSHDATSITISWTANHDNGQTEVQYKRTSDGSWTVFSTVAIGTEQETITGLENGQEYEVRPAAKTEHTSSALLDVTVTTDLPDAQQPTLGNGVEDEISVDIPDDTNYGDYRVQTRESGESDWSSAAKGRYALSLAGSDDVTFSADSGVESAIESESFTVAFRIERTGSATESWQDVLQWESDDPVGGSPHRIERLQDTDDLVFYFNDDGSVNAAVASGVFDGDEHTVVFVAKNGTMDAYVDDVLVDDDVDYAGDPDYAGSIEATGAFEINPHNNYEFIIDEYLLTAREWSQSDVDGFHNGDVPTENAVHYLRFNEGSGTTATDSVGSNDGTISGATYVEHDDFGDEQTVASDTDTSGTVSTAVTGLEDGEEYEVRVRTETEHVTGAWTAPVSIVTKFPGATGLTATNVSNTRNDLAWNDNSDNEDGSLVLREQLVDGSYWPAEEIADLPPNTTTYQDTTAQPNRTYRYTVRPYTEHTSADSNTDTATTTGPDLPTDPAPAKGWYAEVDLPNGETVQPTLLEGAQFPPVLKDLPRCHLPVPKADRWEDSSIDGQPLRVWKDGHRLPIDEVRGTTRRSDRDIVHGVGGTELDQHVEGIEHIETDAHTGAEQLVSNETSYNTNFDDPATNDRGDVLMQEGDSEGVFQDAIVGYPFADTTPLEVTGDGRVLQIQSAFFQEAEDVWASGDDGIEVIDSQGRWSGNSAIELTGLDTITFGWQVQNPIPQGEARAVLVFAIPSDPTPGFTIEFDETQVDSVSEGALSATADQFDLRTYTTQALNPNGDLSPGSYQLEIILDDASTDLILDFVHFRDDRWSYDEDVTPSSGIVTGWQEMPDAQDVEFAAVSSVEQVTGGLLTVVINDTTGQQALHVRNDTAGSYSTQANTDTIDVGFGSNGQEIQGKVTLGRFGDQTASGEYGNKSQEVSSFELRADLVDTPTLLDFSAHGKIKDLLNRMAEPGDSIWEVRLDANGAYVVEWTQPGQRTTDRDLGLVEYSGRHTVEQSYEKAIVYGTSVTIDDERFTVSSSTGFGNFLGLNENYIVINSERVYDPDTGTEYSRGTDYNMLWQEGAIELISGGSMNLDTEYAIDYNRKTRGEYTLPSAGSDPRTIERDLPGADTDTECGQLALGLVKELQDPLEEVTAQIDEASPRWSLVDALTTDQLPFDGPLEIRELDTSTPPLELRLGSRKSVQEAVEQFNDRLEAIASRV